MLNPRSRRLVAGATLSALVLAACGSGDDDVSKAEFIVAADEVCAEWSPKIEEALAPLEDADGYDDIATTLTSAVEVARSAVADLGEVDRPSEDEEAFMADLTLGYLDDQIESLVALRDAAADRDDAAFADAVAEGEELDETATEAARSYGFRECGIPDDEDETSSDPAADVAEDVLGDLGAADGSTYALGDVTTAIQAEGLAIVDFSSVASFAEDSVPAPRASGAYELSDGTIVELFEYADEDELADAEPSLSSALADYEFEQGVTLAMGANIAAIVVGSSADAELVAELVALLGDR